MEYVEDDESILSHRKFDLSQRLKAKPDLFEDQYRTQELRMARIIDEKKRQDQNNTI